MLSDDLLEDLLEIVCCPQTHQRLELLTEESIKKIQETLSLEPPLQSALIREDRRVLYPIREGIPVLLIEEAISLPEEL